MSIVWHPAPGNEIEVVNTLKSEGVQIRSGLGFDPMTIIAVALGLNSLIGALIKLYRNARYKGVLIDTTVEPVQVREMPGWPSKKVLLITKEGAQFQDIEDGDSAAGELQKIAEIIKK